MPHPWPAHVLDVLAPRVELMTPNLVGAPSVYWLPDPNVSCL
jgi:hypothetical protein